MVRRLDLSEWRVVVVDKIQQHYYQPGFLFASFGMNKPEDIIRPTRNFMPRNLEFILSDIELIEPDENRVRLTKDNQVIHYDYLVIATGTDIHPEETEGLKGAGWRQNVFDFYTFDGSQALSKYLEKWQGGRLVVNVAEMPIKCPVAPLEFLFLADWYFQKKGIRNKVELLYATPLPGAFTKPRAAAVLGDILKKKNIIVEPEFNIGEVDNDKQLIRSYDQREVPYDLLVSIPTNMGAEVIERSGMGDELNYVPVDKYTLQSNRWPNVWVIGDATNIPTSKAGSVAHFESDIVIDNILAHMKGRTPDAKFDGHSNCFIESGYGKAFLIDFNYDVEPLPGEYPVPIFGPMSLLKETTINHWGKLSFIWAYWNILLKGMDIPIPSRMQMAGKHV